MRNRKLYLSTIALAFASSALISCGVENKSGDNKDGQLSPSLIENPESANGQQSTDGPVITFEKEKHDFGSITEGEKVEYAFKFKNTGNKDLILESVKAGCGCTIPSYTKEPIKAGETGEINVLFDSQGKPGLNEKSVTVTSNAVPNTVILSFTAQVEAKK